jgi:surface polysaccharide O-acyltransferase-like enzyme
MPMPSFKTSHHIFHLFLEPDLPLDPIIRHQSIFDLMRALACICVVTYHVSSNYQSLFNLSTQGFSWWTSHLFNGLVMNFLAPVFFIISGALLLNPFLSEQPLSGYLKHRLIAILPPFLIGSLFYYSYTHIPMGDFDFGYFITHVWGEPQYYHLWFFYALIALYLAAPIFRTFITLQNRIVIRYGLFLWLLGTGLAPVIQHFTTIQITIIPTVIYNYTGYFIFGAYFFWLRSSNLKRPWAWLGLIAMTAITWFGTCWLTFSSQQFDPFFMDQIVLNIILATFCSVSLISRVNMDSLAKHHPHISKTIQLLGKNSLMIYIFHPFVNDMLPYVLPFLRPERMNPLFRIPLQTILIVSIISGVMGIYRWTKTTLLLSKGHSSLA